MFLTSTLEMEISTYAEMVSCAYARRLSLFKKKKKRILNSVLRICGINSSLWMYNPCKMVLIKACFPEGECLVAATGI